MRILVTGASGFLGSSIVVFFQEQGHDVQRLLRSGSSGTAEPRWDPASGQLDPAAVEGFDVVVHLAGENVAARRWTPQQKRKLRDSRVSGTALLCRALSQLSQPPKLLLSASAIGIYGNRGDEELDEQSPPGTGFLAEVCTAWEAATQPAREAGIRVAHLRFGMILSAEGGALAKMLPPFKMGVGGRLGNGRAFISWVALEDAIGAIAHVMETPSVSGPVNIVSPRPVRNRDFTISLAKALHRPAWFPVPAAAIRLLFGEMGSELLLSSTRVLPRRLIASGYSFRYSAIDAALRGVLAPPNP